MYFNAGFFTVFENAGIASFHIMKSTGVIELRFKKYFNFLYAA